MDGPAIENRHIFALFSLEIIGAALGWYIHGLLGAAFGSTIGAGIGIYLMPK